MTATRHLIVNADDFGLTGPITQGILRAHAEGIVTSTSLMVRAPAAAGAVEAAREHPGLSLGLHLDLGEWVYRDGEWAPSYVVVDTDDRAAVEAEVGRQIEAFEALAGGPPTHLDSHQHVHREEPARSVAVAAAAALGIPLRHRSPVRYCGAFYGQGGRDDRYPEAITPAALAALIAGLEPGWTELCCHPGEGADPAGAYAEERAVELASLCDPSVRAALEAEGIELRSFREAPRG